LNFENHKSLSLARSLATWPADFSWRNREKPVLFKNWIALWALIIQYEPTWIGDKFCKSYERFKENLPPIQIHSYMYMYYEQLKSAVQFLFWVTFTQRYKAICENESFLTSQYQSFPWFISPMNGFFHVLRLVSSYRGNKIFIWWYKNNLIVYSNFRNQKLAAKNYFRSQVIELNHFKGNQKLLMQMVD
jgi:hypothetical protein